MRRTVLVSVLVGVALLPAGAAASGGGRTLLVDDDRAECPRAQYTSIQAAVDAAQPGDTIAVCPGTYVEQVTIPAGKDDLRIYSTVRRQAVIKAPATSNATFNPTRPDLVRIEGAKDTTLARFTITGPFPAEFFCNPLLVSLVRVLNGGSATLADNRITQARSTAALAGCQNGFGVQIGRRFESQTGTGVLVANEIDEYNKGGIYVDGPRSRLFASGNVVRGPNLAGVNPVAAPNGVQISRGSDAYFAYNRVLDNVFPGVFMSPGVPVDGLEPGQASGIIVFNNSGEDGAAGNVRIEENLVQNNDVNIGLFNRDRALIRRNRALDAPFFDGLFADSESVQNLFVENTALRNKEHDCHDDSRGSGTAGTANVWKDDTGVTQTPPGICKPPSNDGHGGSSQMKTTLGLGALGRVGVRGAAAG
jgi:hypothetical protein